MKIIASILLIFFTFTIGCNNNENKKEVAALKKEIDELHKSMELIHLRVDKPFIWERAELNPAEKGFSRCRQPDGMIYLLTLENIAQFPGGVKYSIGVINIYSISLTGVKLTVVFDDDYDSKASTEIIDPILPGHKKIVQISKLIDNNVYPKKLYVDVDNLGGIRSFNQF